MKLKLKFLMIALRSFVFEKKNINKSKFCLYEKPVSWKILIWMHVDRIVTGTYSYIQFKMAYLRDLTNLNFLHSYLWACLSWWSSKSALFSNWKLWKEFDRVKVLSTSFGADPFTNRSQSSPTFLSLILTLISIAVFHFQINQIFQSNL